MPGSKTRQFRRVPYTAKITINDNIHAKCNDISEGGLFVHLQRTLQPGSTVKIKFPTGLTVQAVVQVIRAIGVGLMFSGLTEEQAAGIKAIVDSIKETLNIVEAKPTVLMVEDSEKIRKIARSKLEPAGLEVLEANDGMEALRMLGSEVPDVILLDLYMERMDGYKLLSYIKQIDNLKNIPVVVFSSKFSEEERDKLLKLGADEFLHKTKTKPSELIEVIKGLLKNRKQPPAG